MTLPPGTREKERPAAAWERSIIFEDIAFCKNPLISQTRLPIYQKQPFRLLLLLTLMHKNQRSLTWALMRVWLSFVLFALSTHVFAIDAGMAQDPHSAAMQLDCPAPWFTGPIITPSGHVVPKGYINVEPYVFYTSTTGEYDNHWNFFSTPLLTRSRFVVPIYVGLTEWSNILVIPAASWSGSQGVSELRFNDFTTQLDFQILHDTQNNSLPGLKVYISETFPTGNFQKLDPDKFLTDQAGQGSFLTSFGAIITRLFELKDCHWLSARFNGFVSLPSNVRVEGFNVFGGAPDTKATVKPGMGFVGQLGLEYTLTQNWVLANDFQVIYENRTSFSGFPGTNLDGSRAILGSPPRIQFSLAPGIEYNFNASVGLLAGAWFSFAGRNTSHFVSAVLAINYFGPTDKGTKHRFRFSGGVGGAGSSGGGAGGG